ncbi:MAG: hypothetical protein NXI31_13735 [bacterium]|nr:hypothetical protein [bacterium]
MPRSSSIRVLLTISGLAVITLGALALTPVPKPTTTNTFVVRGELQGWHETEHADLAIRLKGDDYHYYLNRHRQCGLDFERMRAAVTAGQRIELTVVDRSWSPLDPLHSTRPVAAIAANGEVFVDRVQR